jgi:hypothetical protein
MSTRTGPRRRRPRRCTPTSCCCSRMCRGAAAATHPTQELADRRRSTPTDDGGCARGCGEGADEEQGDRGRGGDGRRRSAGGDRRGRVREGAIGARAGAARARFVPPPGGAAHDSGRGPGMIRRTPACAWPTSFATPSVSGCGAARGVEVIRDRHAAWRWGFDDGDRRGGQRRSPTAVAAAVRGGTGGVHIVLLGHIDTVPGEIPSPD